MKDQLLEDKRVILTGCAANIGRATANLFSDQGARLLLVDRDPAAKATVDEITAKGSTAYFVQADVADPAAVRQVFNTAVVNRPGFNGDIVDPEGWAAWSHHESTPTSYASEPRGWRSMRGKIPKLAGARSIGSASNSVSTPKRCVLG
ncbi:MAG: SDR family NAD(P)-dependent oxidoreductase [Brevibacterium sp.]|uniref:SDR family NAD(P)-dependent oxidoreductase n=1 Tax=Brevibacterium sp. TaxID=1701 RepID=UPI0026494715|nr:SDR family NAD(P)-dependent oxidoreductase [Brevibacterium sp.]MDN5806528.1 SDR family NAD(P)-dependent oxidoreductase [Brevibacterium sp.]MDN5833141.1 SDR family NAD(P)-dependent oxidoreductase [Brevibacterium sp.]MDN5876926.1 SDR family NAD(P)-dependent oxidoreductase [Brevibacterium sp.]MDN5908684.1 SDR family NAD(P)-dependent oxidoreductase [Brevibacterium sp.]MDN6133617.1 SDR family NAD(P)-dependent oxidoreductase [Brevibacterium sp.]